MTHPFDAVTEATLRKRQSAKWRQYAPDVLPAWVAEMDYPLADPIKRALHSAIDDDDTGYPYIGDLGAAFAPWAREKWGFSIDPADVHLCTDVVTAIAEILRVATSPGDGVVIEPPVYAPFASTIRVLGRNVIDTPLARNDSGWSLDLDAIERAYAGGARAHLLCSPHNPTGIVHSRAALERIADVADRYGVLVISDEIHGPLALRGAVHVPFPSVSPAAARRSILLGSASKAWNLAGLKAAMMIACSDEARAVLARLPPETPYHAGHLGVLAAKTAFREGNPWLESALAILDRNRALLADLVAAELPGVRYVPPAASYLAWLDFGDLGLGDDPARRFLDRGRVALSPGLTFGKEGAGFARLNIATTRSLLEEAVRRIALAIRG